jgi:hypothetical protein
VTVIPIVLAILHGLDSAAEVEFINNSLTT